MAKDKMIHIQAQRSALGSCGALLSTKAQSVVIREIRGFLP
jgi:hypothetical protein